MTPMRAHNFPPETNGSKHAREAYWVTTALGHLTFLVDEVKVQVRTQLTFGDKMEEGPHNGIAIYSFTDL